MFIFIFFTYPILFLLVATIADSYLATGMTNLSKKFKLSPSVAAMTLIAFANGAPDVLTSLSNKGGEAYVAGLATLLGGFVFSSTLVIGNVAY